MVEKKEQKFASFSIPKLDREISEWKGTYFIFQFVSLFIKLLIFIQYVITSY
jgi:hypothetical protein